MQLMTKPYMRTGNALKLPIDIYDPSLVLYAPLWYPNGDMTGSTIYSYDLAKTACTVTGATWGPTGRTMSGTTQYIDGGTPAAVYAITGAHTVISWCSMAAPSAGVCRLLGFGGGPSGLCNDSVGNATVRFKFRTTAPNTQVTSYATLAANTWYMLSGYYDGNNVALYQNLTQISLIAVGAFTTNITGESLRIGYDAVVAGRYWNGIIGDCLIYNRALSLAEITNIYEKTKWRYG